jgi:predicted dehydrogenase
MIGSGWIAPRHARAWQAHDVEIVALVSKDLAQARTLCTTLGIAPRIGDSVDALAAIEFDFVDVLVPPEHTAGIVARLAPRGKPLLCEKPLGLSLAECEIILASAHAHGAPLMVMHNQVFFRPHIRAREIIAAGEIGEPKLLRTHLVGYHSALGTWKESLAGRGGMIWDDGIHRIYTAQFLLGAIASVSGMQHQFFPEAGEGPFGSATFVFQNGAMGVWDFSYRLGGGTHYDDSVTVIGTEGIVHVNGCYGRPQPMARLNVRIGDTWRAEPIDDDWENTFVRLVEHFLACVDRREDSLMIGGRSALQTIRVAEAIATSFATGRKVTVGGVDASN